jgi:hypothetical protein
MLASAALSPLAAEQNFDYVRDRSVAKLKLASFSLGLSRALVGPADLPIHAPDLVALLDELDARWGKLAMAGRHKNGSAVTRLLARTVAWDAIKARSESVGRYRQQTDFYFRLATSPAVQTICEIGVHARIHSCC